MRDPRTDHASGKQATLFGPRTRLPYHPGEQAVDFHAHEPGLVLGGNRDSGGPTPVSGSVRAEPIGCRIELRIASPDRNSRWA